MSKTKTLADKLKSLPSASGANCSVFVFDSAGNPMAKPMTEIGCLKKVSVDAGSVLRFSRLTSVLVSARGSNTGRCALIWISSYGNGDPSRTTAKCFYNSSAHYLWYVNGSSENVASVYLVCNGTSGPESIAILSLFGELPQVEVVSSVPSDATPIVFTNT